jgi:hypothetical protein
MHLEMRKNKELTELMYPRRRLTCAGLTPRRRFSTGYTIVLEQLFEGSAEKSEDYSW